MAKVRTSCSPNVRFTKYDLLALCLAIFIPVTAVVLTLVSVLPSLGAPPLPSFEDPTKGFEPRGTELSDKIVTYENFVKALNNTQLRTSLGTRGNETSLVNDANTSKRKRRSVQTSLQPPLLDGVVDSMVFVYKALDPKENLFEASKLKTICAMDTEIVRSSPSFELYCYNFLNGSKTNCYSSWSIGNYVALLNNRKSCQDITDDDVLSVKNLLQNCSSHFVKQTLKENCKLPDDNETVSSNCPTVPAHCIQHTVVYNIFQYLVDNEFMVKNDDFLKYTLSIPPVPLEVTSFYEEMYNDLKDSNHVKKGVELVTFRFYRYKYYKFSKEMFVEIIFPALALVVVFSVMWYFLGSFILTFCGLFCVIYATGLSYFLYNIVFGMDFFPFLNVLTLVFLVGIGADDTFVYYDIWRQTRAANPNATIMQLTLKSLQYSALSMLVTSLTTASAFFAGISSDITAIKCFGIFAGTSILTNYLLMITYFPAVVALHEKWIMKYREGQESLDAPLTVELAADKTKTMAAPTAQDMSENREASGRINSQGPQEQESLCILQVIDFPCSLAASVLNAINRFSSKCFERWLPFVVIKFYWIWIFLLIGLTAGFLCVNFVKPGLQLPESDELQTFASSHTLEIYNFNYKSFFRFEQSGSMSIELIWGIKPADNGNFFNPDDKGTLEFDESFGDLFTPDSQRFLHSLCTSVQKQSFFGAFVGESGCPIEGLITACTAGPDPCCGKNASFPFPTNVTKTCLFKYASTGRESGVLFDPKSETVRGFRMVVFTKQPFTTAFSIIDDLFNEVNAWFKTEISKDTTPDGLKNGWAGSFGFRFYGLQTGLSEGTYSSLGISVAVSFVVMLLTTLNILISIYAIVTIIGTIAITIGSLVLAGWQLNILESIVMSVAVGLSIDFTMHYGVAYRLAPERGNREKRVCHSLVHIGSAITMAALTTFLTGLMMMPATVLMYLQLGQFLMLVMVFSWFFSTFSFLSICSVIGPKDNFGQLSISHLFKKCARCLRRVKPVEDSPIPADDNKLPVVYEYATGDIELKESNEKSIANEKAVSNNDFVIVNEDAISNELETVKEKIVSDELVIVNEEATTNKEGIVVNEDAISNELETAKEKVVSDELVIVNEEAATNNKEGIVNEEAASENGLNTPL